ncbi:MAG: hypothetical protein Q9185_004355 [Variospora sp. 1 TL-2023]
MVQRLAKGVLPPNTQIQKDAITAMSKGATVFVSYIADKANEITLTSNRKTISPNAVLDALAGCEFPDFLPRVEAELKRFNEIATAKRNEYRRKVKEKETEMTGADADADAKDDAAAAAAATMDAVPGVGGLGSDDDDDEGDGEERAKKRMRMEEEGDEALLEGKSRVEQLPRGVMEREGNAPEEDEDEEDEDEDSDDDDDDETEDQETEDGSGSASTSKKDMYATLHDGLSSGVDDDDGSGSDDDDESE